MLSVIEGTAPRDEVECMMAARMAAVHMATMTLARRLNHVRPFGYTTCSCRSRHEEPGSDHRGAAPVQVALVAMQPLAGRAPGDQLTVYSADLA
jgi:hypothetical protein